MALIGVGAIAASPTSVSASGTQCTIHGGGGYGCTIYGGGYIQVCDNQVDGHRVRGHYTQFQSPTIRTTAWAPSRGCTDYAGGVWGFTIQKFRVCIEYEGCTAWKLT